jgi:tripartite ATP-independent transporter DctP family solute receptor
MMAGLKTCATEENQTREFSMKDQTGIGRRSLLCGSTILGAGLGMLSMPSIARAARTIRFKYGTNVPVTNPLNIRLNEAFTRIGEETGGEMKIQLYPDNQLGSDAAMINQIRSGALEMYSASGVIISTLVPGAAISGLGFSWKNEEQVFRALDGDLGGYVRRELLKADLIAMDRCWDVSFKTMTSSSIPIRKPEDLNGFKLRVPIGQLGFSLFQAFGASPTTINFSEVYSALQTKIVNGTELPLITFATAKLWEVQKYVSITNHMWDGLWQVANARKWNALPPEMQAIIQKHMNASALEQRKDTITQNQSIARELPTHGIEVVTVNSDDFRAKLRTTNFYPEWKEKFGNEAWTLLEKYAEPLV